MLQRDVERELIEKAQQGDQKAQDELVLSHRPMIQGLRRRGYPEHIWEDIESQAVLGLIRAVQNFDLSNHETRFSTYARWWVMETVGTYVRKNAFAVKYGTGKYARRIYSRLPKLLQGLHACGAVSQQDLEQAAQELEVPLHLVESFWQAYSARTVAGSTGYDDERSHGRFDTSYDPNEDYEAADENEAQRRVIREALDMLAPHHRRLLERRLFCAEPCSVEEVANELGVLPSRIPALETRAKAKLVEFARGIAELDGLAVPSVDQFIDAVA